MTYSLRTDWLAEAAEYAPPSIRLFVVPEGIRVVRRWALKERAEIVSFERLVYSVGNPLVWAIDKLMASESGNPETQNRVEESF